MSRGKDGKRPGKDPFTDPDWKAYAAHAAHEMIPKMLSSAVCISLMPDDPRDLDMKYCLELGAMILMDKPLITIHPTGTTVPVKLAQVSDLIQEVDWTDPSAQDVVAAAIKKFAEDRGLIDED